MEDKAFERSLQKPNRLFLLGLIILIGGIAFGAYKLLAGSQASQLPVPTPTPTEIIFPTDTPTETPETSPTPESTNTPTPKPTANPVDEATGLDRSELSVFVQNGSGETGAASKMAEVLRSFGYRVAKIGNADTTDYEEVNIEVKSDKSSFLALLKKDIALTYSVGSTSAVLSATASADAIVIVGKQ